MRRQSNVLLSDINIEKMCCLCQVEQTREKLRREFQSIQWSQQHSSTFECLNHCFRLDCFHDCFRLDWRHYWFHHDRHHESHHFCVCLERVYWKISIYTSQKKRLRTIKAKENNDVENWFNLVISDKNCFFYHDYCLDHNCHLDLNCLDLKCHLDLNFLDLNCHFDLNCLLCFNCLVDLNCFLDRNRFSDFNCFSEFICFTISTRFICRLCWFLSFSSTYHELWSFFQSQLSNVFWILLF